MCKDSVRLYQNVVLITLVYQKTGKKSRTKKSKGDESESRSLTSNLATTLRNRYSSSDYDRVRERPRPLPNPADEWDENGDLTDKRR